MINHILFIRFKLITLLESMNTAIESYSIIQVEAKIVLRSKTNVSISLFTPKVFIQTYKPITKL